MGLIAFFKSINMNSIRSKIFGASIAGVIIPMLIVGAISFSVTSGILKSQISRSKLQNIAYVNRNLELVLKETDKSANQILKNSTMIQFIEDSVNNRFESMENYDFLQKKRAIESILKNYIVSRSSIAYINISLANIQVSAKSEINYQLDYINLFNYDNGRYYNGIKQGGRMYSWEDGAESIFEDSNWLLYNQIIYDPDTSEDIGVLSIAINKAYFANRLHYNNIFEGRGLFAIVREGNPVILLSDTENYYENEEVKGLLQSGNETDKNGEYSSFTGNCLISQKYSEYADWSVVNIIPTSVVTKGAGRIRLITIIVIISCFILTALFATIMSNKVVNPIKRLINATKKMEQGDLEIKFDDTKGLKKSRLENFLIGSDSSFRVKIARTLIIIFIFPVITLIFASYFTSLNVVEREFRLTISDSIAMMNLNLQLSMSSLEQDSKYLLTDPLIQNVMTEYNKTGGINPRKYPELENKLMQNVSYGNNLMYIGLFDLTGKNIYSTTNAYYNKEGINNENWYSKISATSGEAVLTDTYKDNLNNMVFSCVRKVNSLDPNIYVVGEPLGYIMSTYSENYLYNVYSSFVLKGDRDIFLVNEEGKILSAKNKAMLDKPAYDLIQGGGLEGPDGSEILLLNGKRNLVIHENVLGVKGWKLVAIVPLNDILEYNKNILIYNIYILMLSLIVLIVISQFISLKMSKPISKLKSDMRKVSKGEMSIDSVYNDKDEISQLGNSFTIMVKRLRELINENFEIQSSRHRAELGQKEAEMSALQAQINPHFLYNTLESINWIAIDLLGSENDISKTVKALSNLFRSSIDFEGKVNTIGRQIEELYDYIFIQKLRHGDRISVNVQVDEALYQYKALRLILQPIVENAVNHGLRDVESNGMIEVKGWKNNGKVYFKIIDNGCGISSEKLDELRNKMKDNDIRFLSRSIGLINTNSRIKAFYGNEYGIEIESNNDSGTQVTVVIPLVD